MVKETAFALNILAVERGTQKQDITIDMKGTAVKAGIQEAPVRSREPNPALGRQSVLARRGKSI